MHSPCECYYFPQSLLLHVYTPPYLAGNPLYKGKVMGGVPLFTALRLAAHEITAFRLPSEEKREQELRSLKSIDDSFLKFVITEDTVRRYQDDNGVVFMNILEFLLDENSLQI